MKEAREELAGWVWVGAGGIASVLVPLWVLLTAVVIQLTPELAGFRDIIELGVETGDRPSMLWAWTQGGMGGALLLLIGLPLIGGFGAAAWVTGRAVARRQDRARRELDEALRDDAVLEGVSLEVHAERSFDPRLDAGETDSELSQASRGRRVAAVLVDSALLLVPYPILPAIVAGLSIDASTGAVRSEAVVVGVAVGGLVATVALGIYQLVRLSQTGQTVGKRLLGVKVVRSDGADAGFWHAVVLRLWAFNAACVILPVIGWFVLPIVDLLMLMGEDGRTLHDLLADTVVVDAPGR